MAKRRRAKSTFLGGVAAGSSSASIQVAGPAIRSFQAQDSATVPSAEPTHRDRSSLIKPNGPAVPRAPSVSLSNIEEQPTTIISQPNHVASGPLIQESPPTQLTSVAPQQEEEEVAGDNIEQEHPQLDPSSGSEEHSSIAHQPSTTGVKRSVKGKEKQKQGKCSLPDVPAGQHYNNNNNNNTPHGQDQVEVDAHLDPTLLAELYHHQHSVDDNIAPTYHLGSSRIDPENLSAGNALEGMSSGSHHLDMSYSAIQASPSMMNSSHSGLVAGPYASDNHSQHESQSYPSSSSHPVYTVYSSGSGDTQLMTNNNVDNGSVSAQYQAMYDVPPNGSAPSSSHQPLVTPSNGNGSTRPSSSSSMPHGMPVMLPDQSAKHAAQMSGGKIFRCKGFEGCDMTFTRSEHLARHVRKHTGERPFPCHCHKSFSRLDNLRQHAATVHSDQADLNERMLRALAPVHAALSQRAGKEQKKRGEVLELPKQAKKSPTETWGSGGRALPSHGGSTLKQESGSAMHEGRPTSSVGPGPGVVYNGQAYTWSQPAGSMVPPSPQTSAHGKLRADSISSHWDPQTSPHVSHYERPSTAASTQHSDRVQGLMAAPQGPSHNRLPQATIPPRPSTSHAAPSARFGKTTHPSRPDSQFAHNPFPYGLRPASGQTGARSSFTPRASSEAPGGNVVGDTGYPPSSSGTANGFNQQVINPSWSYPPSGQSIQPMSAVEFNNVNPSYDSTPYVDTYGPPPPATAPSVFHFGPPDNSIRFEGQVQQQQQGYPSSAGASGQQYSALSGSSNSGGQSSRGSGSSGHPIPAAPTSGGGMHPTPSALRDIYGNPSSTSESPFSYHPPPTATQPPSAPVFSIAQQQGYPGSPTSSGSLSRKRPLSSREGYSGQPNVKMQRLDQPQEMMGLPSSSSGIEMSGGGIGGQFAHAPPPIQPTGTDEQWFPQRSERRSSLAIASLVSAGTTGPDPNDEYSYGPPHGQEEEVWSGPGDYAYEVANVEHGQSQPQQHQHQQQHQQQRGQHEQQHQMAVKAKALLGQYDG